MHLSNTPDRPSQHVTLDIVGPLKLTQNRNKYLLTFQELFLKYKEVIPITDQTTHTAAKIFVTHTIYRHGCSEKLTTD